MFKTYALLKGFCSSDIIWVGEPEDAQIKDSACETQLNTILFQYYFSYKKPSFKSIYIGSGDSFKDNGDGEPMTIIMSLEEENF